MSTRNTTPTYECEYCDTEQPQTELHAGSFCSPECKHRHTGRKFLNNLKYDHRFCHSDFTKLKEVSRPTDEQLRKIDGQQSTEAVIGFQYPTKHADHGEKTGKPGVIDVVRTGIVCGNCGTTDHSDDFLREFDIETAVKRLKKRVRETREEGQHDHYFDAASFVDGFTESNGDWEYAVGKALGPQG